MNLAGVIRSGIGIYPESTGITPDKPYPSTAYVNGLRYCEIRFESGYG